MKQFAIQKKQIEKESIVVRLCADKLRKDVEILESVKENIQIGESTDKIKKQLMGITTKFDLQKKSLYAMSTGLSDIIKVYSDAERKIKENIIQNGKTKKRKSAAA